MITWHRARLWIPWIATALGGLFLLYDHGIRPMAHGIWTYWERPAFAEIHRVEVKQDSTAREFKGALYDMVDIIDSPPNSEIRHELVHSFKKKHQ